MSGGVEAEIARLLEVGLKSARAMLGSLDGFTPFGLGVSMQGEVKLVNGEKACAAEAGGMIEETEEQLRMLAEAGLIRGAAVVTDVWLTDRVTGQRESAVRIHLEHPGRRALTCLVPYHCSYLADEPDFGEAIFEEADPVIFA